MLISETHFTAKRYTEIPNYTIYDTQHPDGRAHGGTTIIIKNGLKRHLHVDAQLVYFIIRLLQSSTCFEQRRANHQELNFY